MNERDQNLRIIRIENIRNALYMAESEEEVWEALQFLCPHSIKILHGMCNEILENSTDEDHNHEH